MESFNYFAPTQVVFGKETEKQAGALCLKYGAHKVLVHYGGQSAVKSGLIDRVCASLKDAGLDYVLLGGVVPNPHLSKIYEGIALCKKENVDFILAVGGGSVIDSAKGIGYGLANEGDVWDYYAKKRTVTACAPVACVLTMAAAGSEMSNSSVVTNEEGWLKRGLHSPYAFCRFAIMNPELTYTLPAYQTASGAADIILHTLERYFVAPSTKTLDLVDGYAEHCIRTVMKNVKLALKNPEDYDARAELMWAGTTSHNGVTGDRDLGDWASHQIEHELSAMFSVPHGAGLAAIWGSWARYVVDTDTARFAKLAVNVFGIAPDFKNPEKTALAGIEAMESFFRHIGMPTNIHELIGRELTEEEIKELAYKCSFMNTRQIGMLKKLGLEDMENIYRAAK